MYGSRHKANLSLAASVDLDVEGGGRLDEDYDAGWSSSSSLAWSAKGPAAYASTMSIGQSARCHLQWARAGWSDANRWLEAARLASRASEVRLGVLKGFALSSTIVAVIFFFELAFFPKHLFPSSHQLDDQDTVGSIGSVFWLYPLIAGSYYLASSWTLDVAHATYRLKHGTGLSMAIPQQLPPGLSRKLVMESHRILLVLNYTVISLVLQQIPWIGRSLSFAFMSFIDAYYCFEQAWIARGWSLERRMRYAESRWAYMMAFGLPSTAISFFHPSGLLNLMLFMLIFPVCTVLAMLGNPQPRLAPTSATSLTPNAASGGFSPGIANSSTLSALLPPRLPIFWFTVKAYRLILRFFPRLTDANIISEPIMDASRATVNTWRPRPGPAGPAGPAGATGAAAAGSNGYGASAMGTGIDMGGFAGKRGAMAAQFVGGAWNGTSSVGWSNPGSRNVTPTPPPLPYQSPGPPYNNGTFPHSSHSTIAPPPKGAGKKKD